MQYVNSIGIDWRKLELRLLLSVVKANLLLGAKFKAFLPSILNSSPPPRLVALNIFLGVLIWRILGKQKRDTDFSYYFAPLWLYLFPPESFCFGVTSELRNNRTGASQSNIHSTDYPSKWETTDKDKAAPWSGKWLYQWKPSRDVNNTSPEPFMGPEQLPVRPLTCQDQQCIPRLSPFLPLSHH